MDARRANRRTRDCQPRDAQRRSRGIASDSPMQTIASGARVAGAGDYLVAVAGERRVREVGVAVDED